MNTLILILSLSCGGDSSCEEKILASMQEKKTFSIKTQMVLATSND